MRKTNYLIVLVAFLTISCTNKEIQVIKQNNIREVNKKVFIDEDSAMSLVLKIPEILTLSKEIEKETNGKHGAAAIIYPYDSDADSTFRVNVGLNGDVFFQTIYMFEVNKRSGEIKAYDNLKEYLLSLSEWRTYLDEQLNTKKDSLFSNLIKLKRCSLPFDYSKYFNNCLGRNLDSCIDVYPYYKYREDEKLMMTYNKLFLENDEDTAITYFILYYNEKFITILFKISSETKGLNFNLITLNKNRNISELALNKNFIIYPNKIEIYENIIIQESEEGDYDSYTQIENGKLLRSYNITEEGKIIK